MWALLEEASSRSEPHFDAAADADDAAAAVGAVDAVEIDGASQSCLALFDRLASSLV